MKIQDPYWPSSGEVDTEDSAVPWEAELQSEILRPKKLMFFTFLGISFAPGSCIPRFKQDPPIRACDSALSGNYLTAFVKR